MYEVESKHLQGSDLDRKRAFDNRRAAAIKGQQGTYGAAISTNNYIKDRSLAAFMLDPEILEVLSDPQYHEDREPGASKSEESDMLDMGWGFNEDSTYLDPDHEPLTDTMVTLLQFNVAKTERHRMTSIQEDGTIGPNRYAEKANKALANHLKRTTKERKYHGIADLVLNKDGSVKGGKGKTTQKQRKMTRLQRLNAKADAKAKATA